MTITKTIESLRRRGLDENLLRRLSDAANGLGATDSELYDIDVGAVIRQPSELPTVIHKLACESSHEFMLRVEMVLHRLGYEVREISPKKGGRITLTVDRIEGGEWNSL